MTACFALYPFLAWPWSCKVLEDERHWTRVLSHHCCREGFFVTSKRLRCREIEELKISCLQQGNCWEQQGLNESPTEHDLESRTVSLFFYDLDSLSSYDEPTFLIKLFLPRVHESPAAKLECLEMHERIWVFLETFLIVNMLDEILMKTTIVQENWQHHRESLTMSKSLIKEGIEHSGSEEPLQTILLLCFFSKSEEQTSRRQVSLMLMANHAWYLDLNPSGMTILCYLHSEMHL